MQYTLSRLILGSLLRLRPRCFASVFPPSGSGSFWGRPQITALKQEYSTDEANISQSIGRYPIPSKKDLPYDIAELMEEIEVKSGFLPNVFKVMSHRPTEFRAFFAYYNAIMNKETGKLSKADKELIIVTTSIVNKCPYCVIAHGALHRIYSKKPTLADQVTVNWKKADLNDREFAMLEFALAVCRADTITEEHFQKLEAHGFDREDAWDIGSIAAFFAMSNRIAHFTNVHPNPEFYLMGRVPREKEKTMSS
uniref:Carboxymuconolactone decarboxylase-like domain-containing protein n=1 Tax=Salvator merianae TaxID=96440 RepID=A0A8D0BWT8_SALMN